MAHYFITGVSSGIGAALVDSLATTGHRISGVARRKNRLDDLASSFSSFHPFSADVSDTAAMERAVNSALEHHGPIDVAILNAGIYIPQDGTRILAKAYDEHMAVNYMGVVNALAPIIPDMIKRQQGQIAIVSSVAGWRGLPKSAAYGPTKAALISLAESLYFDLTPQGIKLQVICPGFVESEATAVNDFEMPDLFSPEIAASHIISGLDKDQFSIDFPKSFTRKMAFLRLVPDRLYFRLVGKQTGAL